MRSGKPSNSPTHRSNKQVSQQDSLKHSNQPTENNSQTKIIHNGSIKTLGELQKQEGLTEGEKTSNDGTLPSINQRSE